MEETKTFYDTLALLLMNILRAEIIFIGGYLTEIQKQKKIHHPQNNITGKYAKNDSKVN